MKIKKILSMSVVLLALFLLTVEMSGVMPLVPVIASMYQVDPTYVVYYNLGHAFFGMAAPFVGYQADRFGVKRMIVMSMILFTVGSLVILWGRTLLFYVLGRALIGLSFYTMMGISQTYLSSMVSRRYQAFVSGFHRLVFASAILSSPMIGNFLVTTGGFLSFYRFLAMGGSVLVVMLGFVSSIQVSSHKISLESLKETLQGPCAKKMLVSTLLYGLPGILFYSYYSIHLTSSGYDASNIALIYTVIGFGSFMAGVSILTLVKPLGFKRMMTLATLLVPISLLGLTTIQSTMIFVLGFLFGLSFDAGWGLIFPVASRIAPKHPSTYLTMVSLTMSVGSVLSSLLAPSMFQLGGFYLIMAICIGGVSIAFLLLQSILKVTHI